MTLAGSYARALYDAVAKDAGRGAEYLKSLREALARRGHQKLFPKIFSEYQALVVREERSKVHSKVTPEQEQTRVLLELYRKLTTSHE
jgi:F0F1-type ATP synthase delta subunit